MDVETLTKLLNDRLDIGYSRYGKGLLHPDNDALDYKQEALEEALDLVIYASADAVRKTPPVSLDMKLIYVNDEPEVMVSLKVNYELDKDGNDAVVNNVVNQLTKKYEYAADTTSKENQLMILASGVLSEFVKITPNPHAGNK